MVWSGCAVISGFGVNPFQEIADGHSINSHVGLVRVAEQTQNAFPMWNHGAVQLEFDVLRTSARKICVKVDAIGDFGHLNASAKRKAQLWSSYSTMARICIAARVGGVVPCAIVVYRPIEKLEMTVAADGIVIEEICEVEFSYPELPIRSGLPEERESQGPMRPSFRVTRLLLRGIIWRSINRAKYGAVES